MLYNMKKKEQEVKKECKINWHYKVFCNYTVKKTADFITQALIIIKMLLH